MLVSCNPNRPLAPIPTRPAAPLPALEPVVATDKAHLLELIRFAINRQGVRTSLNHIDVSGIKDMSNLFENSLFNGDISQWDVSGVETMHSMFRMSIFEGDISEWNVKNVKSMAFMFAYAYFDGDISKWTFPQMQTMGSMFFGGGFNGNISAWDVSHVEDISNMFIGSEFRGDLSRWRISESTTAHFFMDAETMAKSSAPSLFHWQAVLDGKLALKRGHPWTAHFAETSQLMELMDMTEPKAKALFLQHAWIGKYAPELLVQEIFALPQLE